MTSWRDFETAEPDWADTVRRRLTAHRHALLATLRPDGAPRLSGVEVQFALGELWMGMMGGSLKALDLHRDPRFALHSAPDSPDITDGDAKLGGVASEVHDESTIESWAATLDQDPPPPFHLFRVDIGEVSLLRAAGDHLVIEWWRPDRGRHRIERR